MAEFDVWSMISFLTLVEGVNWRQEDYNASKMKRFIKLEDINGYFDLQIGGKAVRVYPGSFGFLTELSQHEPDGCEA
ncbi:MAG: hypothetical protein ACRYG8_36220 [Janthinobacterium lividum]